jgi:hypothetical protein
MSMRLSDATVKQFATVGAAMRLRELDAERAQILTAFPDLAKDIIHTVPLAPESQPEPVTPRSRGTRKRRRLTVEQRKAISARMYKYWKAKRAGR